MFIDRVTLKLVLYGLALVIGATDLPSRLLRMRYKKSLPEAYLRFAARTNSAADVIALPLVSLLFAIANIVQLSVASGGGTSQPVGSLMVCGVLLYVAFIVLAFWVLVANIAPGNEEDLPKLSLKVLTVPYDWLVRIVKVVGIIIPAIADVYVAERLAQLP